MFFLYRSWWGYGFFLSVNVVCYTYWFAYAEPSSSPRNKPHLTLVCDHLNELLNGLARTCWGFLCLRPSGMLACNFLFLCCSFWLGIRDMLAFCSKFRSIPSYSTFWKSLRRTGDNSFLSVWKSSPVKPCSSGFCFWAVLSPVPPGECQWCLDSVAIFCTETSSSGETEPCCALTCGGFTSSATLTSTYWFFSSEKMLKSFYLFKKNIS